MATTQASIRIRPIRFGFVVDPRNRDALRQAFQACTTLWGGQYNFIVPAFKRTPTRYRERHLKIPPARALINGLVEAFQPDLLVETQPGLSAAINFDSKRIISIDQLMNRDDKGRCRYGIDLRSVCAALYDETFRFVQRHPLKVVVPHVSEKRYQLLFAATFGEFPSAEPLADCLKHYTGTLEATDEIIEPAEINRLFSHNYSYPLRVGSHELETQRSGWTPDPVMFYMNEQSPYDLIEFWNLRAIGWRIRPLPSTLAEKLKVDCEQFIKEAYKPYPKPSNAFHRASFLCSRSCSMEKLRSFVETLEHPKGEAVSLDHRVPRIWEEWGRSADHADPQVVTYKTKSVDAHLIANSLHLRTAVPDFLELSQYEAAEDACVNVFASIPGGAPVIPWQTADMSGLTGQLADEKIWLGREGIVTTAGAYSTFRFFRAPSPVNVFRAFAQAHKLTLELSEPGRICEQIITALGGLESVRLIAQEEVLKLLDRLAHGDLELDISEITPEKQRRLRMASAPLSYVQEVLMRAHGDSQVADNFLNALIERNVLTLGMRLTCSECSQRSWYSLEDLAAILKCQGCLRQFGFPAGKPPRDAWAYRVLGPFSVDNFAYGSYCVAAALHFLSEEVAQSCTWIPSFKLLGIEIKNVEADFGMFLTPTWLSHVKGPLLIFGECKTFGEFEDRDFERAKKLAELFPGAILCFATFRKQFSDGEKKELADLVRLGRSSLKTGQQINPILLLTSTELFGQFKVGKFTEGYGSRSQHGEAVYRQRDVQECCDFSQQVHLGIESYHDWLEKKRERRAARVAKKLSR